MHITLTEQTIELVLESTQYSLATLHKCFYWYTRDYRVTIQPLSATHVQVQLRPKEGNDFAVAAAALIDQIHNDLLDFTLRELIAEETRPIRELLVAKAFAHFDTEQPLLTELSDPVGFSLLPPTPTTDSVW